MKKTVITDDLIVFSDGFVWKRLSRKAAEALWNSVISHELELYWVRTDDESEAAIERFKDMERAFECGDYVCLEVGKLGNLDPLNTYIEIAFFYKKDLYVERIYTKDIDKNHYENMWDWWFGNKESDAYPDLVFELTADKNSDGKLTTNNMYINVYENENSDTPIDTIKEIGYRKSWCNHKAFR